LDFPIPQRKQRQARRPSLNIDAEGYMIEINDTATIDYYVPPFLVYPPDSEKPYEVDPNRGTCTCLGSYSAKCKHVKAMEALLRLIPSLN